MSASPSSPPPADLARLLDSVVRYGAMQQWYLAMSYYRVFAPESKSDSAKLSNILTHLSRWDVGRHEGKGWFRVQTDPPVGDLTDKIVAVALGRAVIYDDDPLLVVRRADASVIVMRSSISDMIEVDRFQLPVKGDTERA